MTLPSLRIGLVGCGTVGAAFVTLFYENASTLLARTGTTLQLSHIAVRDTKRSRTLPHGGALPNDIILTDNPLELARADNIDLIIELMGGVDTAFELIKTALTHGKHVITANKALLAERGNELFALAAKHNRALLYEASVAGAIPVIQTLKESLAGNHIHTIEGILNGTSNYILSRMTSKNKSFTEALHGAQEKGYAEADPTLDIDGHDTAHKLVLLIRLAWGVDYPYEQMSVHGIRKIDTMDIEFARDFGYRIKLLGRASWLNEKIVAGVFPTLVHHTYLLASVGGAYNAVRIEGNASGPLFLHGLGAGGPATASAVLGDLVMLARNVHTYNTGFINPAPPKASIVAPDDMRAQYYLRFIVRDTPGVLRDLAGALADQEVSIAKATQKGQDDTDTGVPITFLTYDAPMRAIKAAIEIMYARNLLLKEPICCPVLG